MGRFRFNRMPQPSAGAEPYAAAAAKTRRSPGGDPEHLRRHAVWPQPPDRHGLAGDRNAGEKIHAADVLCDYEPPHCPLCGKQPCPCASTRRRSLAEAQKGGNALYGNACRAHSRRQIPPCDEHGHAVESSDATPKPPACGKDAHAPTQALRRLRPLARRRRRMARPLGVAIRARKPWVRALLILLG